MELNIVVRTEHTPNGKIIPKKPLNQFHLNLNLYEINKTTHNVYDSTNKYTMTDMHV